MQPDWEELYQNGTKPWDKGAAAPPLLEWLSANPCKLSGAILIPGCGLGHDVRMIAAHCGDGAEVLGIDISPTALAEAIAFPKAANESYQLWDLFDPPAEMLGRFDWVWEHTCFCAIEPGRRDDYVSCVHQLLKPSGQFLGVFYLDPYDDDHKPGEGPPHGTDLEELEQRFVKSGKFAMIETYPPTQSYLGREGAERVLRLTREPFDPAA